MLLAAFNSCKRKQGDAKLSIYDDFYQISQNIVEKYYLQPLSGEPKQNLQDGRIEREVHGGIHAARTTVFIEVLNCKIKEMFPDFHREVIAFLTKEHKLTETKLLKLIKFAGLCHDAGRKDEYQDQWETKSGKIAYDELCANAADRLTSYLIIHAIVFKDHPVAYEKSLTSNKVDPKNVIYYQYIRILINLADCFDIQRCTGFFEFDRPLSVLSTLPGFDSKSHAKEMLEFTKQVYKVICSQHDMLFPCSIYWKGEIQEVDGVPAYSLAEKLKFEHADDVLAAITQSIVQIPYFAKYLPAPIPHAVLSAVPLAYNPLICETTSDILFTASIKPNFKRLNLHGVRPFIFNREVKAAEFKGSDVKGKTPALKKAFPIVLVCDDYKNAELISFGAQLYRAIKALQIGKEITMIATDSEENQHKLNAHLNDMKIANVKVVLISDLEASQKAKVEPGGLVERPFKKLRQ